jgi:gamma-glutamylputrescine oxidase
VATTSYWLTEPLPAVPVAASAGRVDVAVVGGGVTGCACALTLARAGLRVSLLEAHEIASGASGRNGGFALRGLCPGYAEARATLGAETTRALWELTEHALDRMSTLAGDALHRSGSIRLAVDADEREALRRDYEALREDGFLVSWLDPLPEPLRRLFAGGVVHPGDGTLSPAVWVRRLAAEGARAGVLIAERSPVDREAIDALDAGAVVIAVDGMTGMLAPELKPFVAPMRGQMLATEVLRERLDGRPHYARAGYDYWQQLPNGRLILGGRRDTSLETEGTADDETTAFVQSQLESLAAELLGHAPAITHRWSGCWGQTADLLPLVGRLPGSDRLWVAGGYSGHGNVLGFACGELVAQAILGEPAPGLAAFDPARARSGAASAPDEAGA